MAAGPGAEARSLTAINYIAANPPQYPHHPEVKESLTLYISRVPGTQDVILSTLRPHRKNVTGEDIANSLYYIHLELPGDVPPRKAPRPQSNMLSSTRSSGESARSAIPRKPLPASARVLKSDSLPKGEPAPLPTPGSHVPQYKAYRPENGPSPISENQNPAGEGMDPYRPNPMFQKRLSGGSSEPPPPHFPLTGTPSALPLRDLPSLPRAGLENVDTNIPPAPHSSSPARPATPSQPGSPQPPQRVASPSSYLRTQHPTSPTKLHRRPSSVSFFLTLIRRDPSSGSQVNVGQVSSFATNIPPPSQADPSLNPVDMGSGWRAQQIDIRIDTSGYAKYRGMPSRATAETQAFRPAGSTGPAPSFTQMMQGGHREGTSSAVQSLPAAAEQGFHRQVVMAYTGGWKAGFKKAFHRRDRRGSVSPEGVQSPEEHGAPKTFHTRQGSSSTIGSNHSGSGEEQGGIITQPGPGVRPKGYTFLSPWEGRCEFRTSTSGRSLKLRHVLDSTTKFQFDPREVAQSIQNAQAMGRSRGDEIQAALLGTKPVSELRFNLPSGGDFFGARRNDVDKDNRASRLSKQFSSLLHHRDAKSSDEEYWSDDEEMDLSLGKENAGGGSSGRRVKLGKLIIHDEGLKMLDLVVAANIGVWWTTWGRIDQSMMAFMER
ncbi:hypothetical protein QBC40DRAFT_258729 [Triangularia verruculosa]|uniref:Uncharacterized protein n=1 Tax=Triangularia verruculosa TaxID=2587418 RepID=A0AAN7AQR5_9PEZI|nr:hypothetical protein QBC40DRAFT_258729 [Triangularia verruculosa]